MILPSVLLNTRDYILFGVYRFSALVTFVHVNFNQEKTGFQADHLWLMFHELFGFLCACFGSTLLLMARAMPEAWLSSPAHLLRSYSTWSLLG